MTRSDIEAIGPYRVGGLLATSGMSELLIAIRIEAGTRELPVVLKRMQRHWIDDPDLVAMFRQEGDLLVQLHHPNIVRAHAIIEKQGRQHIVMEFLAGETLDGVLRRLHARGRSLDPALVAYLASEVAAGVHAAHELHDRQGWLGLVHRDVSPSNVMVAYDGTVKLLDFGIAVATTRGPTGSSPGRPEYMSPEQAQGDDLDRRADVFALGIILWEASAGRRLFRRTTEVGTLRAVVESPIAAIRSLRPDYPEALDAIVLRALDRDRSRRLATAEDLRCDLRAAGILASASSLGGLMQELFAERMAEKQAAIEHLRTGAVRTVQLPEADVDPDVQLPT